MFLDEIWIIAIVWKNTSNLCFISQMLANWLWSEFQLDLPLTDSWLDSVQFNVIYITLFIITKQLHSQKPNATDSRKNSLSWSFRSCLFLIQLRLALTWLTIQLRLAFNWLMVGLLNDSCLNSYSPLFPYSCTVDSGPMFRMEMLLLSNAIYDTVCYL